MEVARLSVISRLTVVFRLSVVSRLTAVFRLSVVSRLTARVNPTIYGDVDDDVETLNSVSGQRHLCFSRMRHNRAILSAKKCFPLRSSIR